MTIENDQCIPSESRPIRLPLSELESHPLQGLYYPPTSADENKLLQDDLERNGQRDAIVVRPLVNGRCQVLDGHRRIEALRAIGVTHVDAIVRHDLKDATAAEQEKEFLQINFNRRHLGRLARARVAKRLFILGHGGEERMLSSKATGDLRDQIGKIMGMSGRTLSRWLHLIDMPLALAVAIDVGLINPDWSAKIAALKKPVQEEIAARVAGLTDRKQAVAVLTEFIEIRDPHRHKDINKAVASMARALGRVVHDLGDRAAKVSPYTAAKHEAALRQAKATIDQILRRAEKAHKMGPPPSLAELFAQPLSDSSSGHRVRRQSPKSKSSNDDTDGAAQFYE